MAASLVSNIVSRYPALIKRRARRPPILPTPMKPTVSSDIAQLLEHFFRQPEAIDRSRHATVDCNLEKNFFDLVFRQPVRERPAHMGFNLVRAIECRKHGKIQHAARLAIQTRTPPYLAPAVLGHELL